MTSKITGQSLGSISFKPRSSGSINSKSKKILDQLKRDSDDITKSLAQYSETRKALSERRIAAITNYEAELEEIGDVSDTEDFLDEAHRKKSSNKVEHNLQRIINKNTEDNDDENYDEYENEFDDDNEVNNFK